jgi:mono/diheme cytochrome c family protein
MAGCVAPTTDGGPVGATTPDPSTPDPPATCADELPVRRSWDPAAVARGEALFVDGTLGDGLIPEVGLRNLWAVWGTGPIPSDAGYWEAFRDRYGLLEAPWPNDGLPLGLHRVGGGMTTVSCLLCHADEVAGQPVIGVGNSRLDVQALIDDLIALQDLAGMLGLPDFELPYTITDRTGAAGSIDGVGIGMQISLLYGPPGADIETHFGFQQAAPWWTLKHKDRVYSDGTGDGGNHRSMASTLLAFGMTFAELQAVEPDLLDLQAMMFSLQPPAWPFEVDEALVDDGREVYLASCASCHGDPCDPAVGYPDLVLPAGEVGTDPVRAERWTQAEASWANVSWFGDAGAMTDTDGYLANPLHGVWASAPYLHNGTVPDLASLLDSSARPAVWQRTGAGADDYDPARVGWRFTEPAAPTDRSTPEARRVMDTSVPALSNAGHTYGDALSEAQRAALLEYLKVL